MTKKTDMKGICFAGDIKQVMRDIAEYKGWTVEQVIKLYRLEEVERDQLRKIFNKAEKRK